MSPRMIEVHMAKLGAALAEQETMCAICVNGMPEDRETRLENCSHTYHFDCIKQWVLTKSKAECPMCRSEFSKLWRQLKDGKVEEVLVKKIRDECVAGTCQRCNQNITNAVLTEEWERGENGVPVYRATKCA